MLRRCPPLHRRCRREPRFARHRRFRRRYAPAGHRPSRPGPNRQRPAPRTGRVRSSPYHCFRRGIAGSRHGRQWRAACSRLDCRHTRTLAAGPGTRGPSRLPAARSDCSHVTHCAGCALACFRNHRHRYCLSPETESPLTPEILTPSGQMQSCLSVGTEESRGAEESLRGRSGAGCWFQGRRAYWFQGRRAYWFQGRRAYWFQGRRAYWFQGRRA